MPLSSTLFASDARLQAAADNNPPLREGESGNAIVLLQRALLAQGYAMPASTDASGTPDGVYGKETTARVREFQIRHGLGQDGIAGHDTLTKLDELLIAFAPAASAVNYDRKVRLHFRSTAMPAVPEFTALDNAQRVYDSINVKLEFRSGSSLLVSDEEAIKLEGSDGTCGWDQASEELQVLTTLAGREGIADTDILVYYANKIEEKDGSFLAGCASHDPGKPAVVVSALGSPWTLGHEVGHVLLTSAFSPVHSDDPGNVMFTPTASINANPPGFTAAQAAAIRSSPLCIPV